jgi:hypothetical protein
MDLTVRMHPNLGLTEKDQFNAAELLNHLLAGTARKDGLDDGVLSSVTSDYPTIHSNCACKAIPISARQPKRCWPFKAARESAGKCTRGFPFFP